MATPPSTYVPTGAHKDALNDLSLLDTFIEANKKELSLDKELRKSFTATAGGDYEKGIDKAVKNANKAAELSGGHLSGVGSKAEKADSFFKRLTGKGKKNRFETKKFEEIAEKLQRAQKTKADHPNIPGHDEKIATLTKELETEAKSIFPHVPEIERAHKEALDLLTQQRDKALAAKERALELWHEQQKQIIKTDMVGTASGTAYSGTTIDAKGKLKFVNDTEEKAFRAAYDAEKKDLKGFVEEKGKALRKEVNAVFKKDIKAHEKVLEATKEMTASVEKHTGLKASDHMTATSKAVAKGSAGAQLTESKWKELSALDKFKTAVKGNWEHAFAGKARVGVGLIAAPVLAGMSAHDIGQGLGALEPDKDEKGQALPVDGKLFKGLGEAGLMVGALALALAGGKGRAMAHT